MSHSLMGVAKGEGAGRPIVDYFKQAPVAESMVSSLNVYFYFLYRYRLKDEAKLLYIYLFVIKGRRPLTHHTTV